MVLCGLDVFKHTEALGIPLDIILEYISTRNCVVDWIDFFQSAVECGWNQKTIINKIEYALIDVHGKIYSQYIISRLKEMCI